MPNSTGPTRVDFAAHYEHLLEVINKASNAKHGYSKILLSFNLATIVLLITSFSFIDKSIYYSILIIPIGLLLYSSHILFNNMININELNLKLNSQFKTILFKMKSFEDYTLDVFDSEVENTILSPLEKNDLNHSKTIYRSYQYTVIAIILIFICMILIKSYEIVRL